MEFVKEIMGLCIVDQEFVLMHLLLTIRINYVQHIKMVVSQLERDVSSLRVLAKATPGLSKVVSDILEVMDIAKDPMTL